MVVVIVGRELLVTALRSFLEERGSDFSANLSGKLKMVLQCVAAGSALVYLHCTQTDSTSVRLRRARLDLLVYGRVDLAGDDIDSLFRCGLRLDRLEDPEARTGRAITNVKDQDHRRLLWLPFVALVAASAGVWHWLFKRWRAGEPVIPLVRRKPVPWLGRDVLYLLLLAVLLPGLAASAVKTFAGEGAPQEDAVTKPSERENNVKKHETANPAVDLLGSGDWRMIALATFTAVVVAPLFEEFIFRVLLQGWLEAVWSRQRRSRRELRAGPAAFVPLVLPAALFAMMHFRLGRALPTPEDLTTLFLVALRESRPTWQRSAWRSSFCELAWGPRRRTSAGSRANWPPTPNWRSWPSWRSRRRSSCCSPC